MEKLSKKKLKIIAQMWVGSMLINQDYGFDADLDEEDSAYIVDWTNKQGEKILGKLPLLHSLDDIVEAVKQANI